MKTSTLASAAIVALGIASQASAQTTVYLTGSTAFRSTVYAALENNNGTNNGGIFDAGTVTSVTFGNSTAGSANYMLFSGNIAGSPVYINCAWSGSEAGIASACNTTLTNQDRNGNPIVLNGSPETWVSASAVASFLQAGNNTESTNPAAFQMESSTRQADLTQADTSQTISWTPATSANPATELVSYGTEAEVTFTLAKNVQPEPSNEWTHLSNITLPQLNTLIGSGALPAGFLTGNTTDDDFTVYLVGRNLGSGTRMNTLAGSTYGAHRSVEQYSIGYGVESNDPPQEDALVLNPEGDNGYESGGSVAKALACTNPPAGGTGPGYGSCQQTDPFYGGVGWYAIGYVAPSDALSSGNYGGVATNNWITLDGAISSDGTIENGLWWLWGNEHLYGRAGISGTPNTVGNLLFKGIQKTMANLGYGVTNSAHDPGIPLALMNVNKSSDTGFPAPGTP